MYLTGYIERMDTGTGDIIRKCMEAGLKAPEFIQEEDFKVLSGGLTKLLTKLRLAEKL